MIGRGLFAGYRPSSSPAKGIYDPKAVFSHAASQGQAFAHCPRFPTAAPSVAVVRPVGVRAVSQSRSGWPSFPDQLPVIGLVGRYLTNYLIGRESILDRNSFHVQEMPPYVISGISFRFRRLSQSQGQVTHVLLTRSPLIPQSKLRVHRSTCMC